MERLIRNWTYLALGDHIQEVSTNSISGLINETSFSFTALCCVVAATCACNVRFSSHGVLL
jgi:hypothetical protein